MVFGLSTGHEIGLACVGAAFIAFSLISSFVLPARNPNFPGRRRNLYLAVCVCFFLAMMAAVLVFGREQPESEAAGNPPATTTTAGGGGGGAPVQGDPTAGEAIFKTKGCTACHTLK